MYDLTTNLVMDKIENEMVTFIRDRCIEHRIITEEDLQVVSYSFLLDIFIETRWYDDWRAFNKLYDKKQAKYPDLTLFRGTSKKIILELKQEVDRDVTKEDIGEDIAKVSGILSGDEELSFGVVLATILDPIREIRNWLNDEYSEQLKNDKLKLILIDVSENIGDISNWIDQHHEMKQAFRRA